MVEAEWLAGWLADWMWMVWMVHHMGATTTAWISFIYQDMLAPVPRFAAAATISER